MGEMLQMGSWTVVERTDDKLTIVYKRRNGQPKGEVKKDKSRSAKTVDRSASSTSTRSTKSSSMKKKRKTPKPITPIATTTRSTSTKKSTKSSKSSKSGTKPRHRRIVLQDEKLDENTENALRNIRDINKYLRCKYNIKPDAPATRKSSRGSSKTTRSSSRSTQTRYSTTTDPSDSLEEFSNAEKMYREISKTKISEAVDHKGYPLSHPLATTPFPGATSAAQREKARQMLRSLGRRQSGSKSEAKSTSKKSSRKSEKSSKSSKKSRKSTKSSKSKSRNSNRTCPSCSACSDCTQKCIEKNHMVTDAEREKFLSDIVRLREVIQRPEKRREKHMKSPFDHTQSGSDNSIDNRRSSRNRK